MSSHYNKSRRRFIQSSGLLLGAAAVPAVMRPAHGAPAIITLDGARPQLAQSLQIGDVRAGRALIWSRSDRPAPDVGGG